MVSIASHAVDVRPLPGLPDRAAVADVGDAVSTWVVEAHRVVADIAVQVKILAVAEVRRLGIGREEAPEHRVVIASMKIQQTGRVEVLAGVVLLRLGIRAGNALAPWVEALAALIAGARAAGDTHVAKVIAMQIRDRVSRVGAVAQRDDLPAKGVVSLDRAAARLLPQPAQVHRRGAAGHDLEALAVGVVGVALGRRAIGHAGQGVVGIAAVAPARATLQVAVAIVAVARATCADHRVSLVERAGRAAGALRAVAAHPGLAGDVAQRVVGHRDVVGQRCGRHGRGGWRVGRHRGVVRCRVVACKRLNHTVGADGELVEVVVGSGRCIRTEISQRPKSAPAGSAAIAPELDQNRSCGRLPQ